METSLFSYLYLNKLSLMKARDVDIIITKGKVMDVDIYYEVVGKGFPVVLLHGNGEDHHIFDELSQHLLQKYQFILIDSRYHGLSVHDGKLLYQQMCDDVMKVLDELKIEAYDVIGFSDGGIIALLLGMKDQRLKHMIAIGANTKPQAIKLVYRLQLYLSTICLLPFCLYNRKARLNWRLNLLMLKEPHISKEDLSQIKVPVLVMAGEYDMIKEEDTKAIAQALQYGALKIIKHGNHFLLRDYFPQTKKEIELFLEICHQEEEI